MFIKNRIKFFLLSGALMVISAAAIVFGGFNLGVDFAGGTVFQFALGEEFSMEEVQEVLAPFGLDGASLQRIRGGEGDGGAEEGVIIKTVFLENSVRDQVVDAFEDRFPNISREDRRIESVGAVVGGEQFRRSLLALLFAFAGMVIYITIRFEFKFAVSTIAALLHDVLLVLGVFAILQMEINLPFVAALLTIIGYSINDSIVIIDRIRENMKRKRKDEYPEMVNLSIMQSLTRSFNTSLTTLLVLGSLLIGFYYFIGSLDLILFITALVIGIVLGTYSSIFIASPLWLALKQWEFRRKRSVHES